MSITKCHELTFSEEWVQFLSVSRKLKKSEKVCNAGISLEPELKARAVAMARQMGFRNLSAYVRFLLAGEIRKEQAQQATKG